ncbi:hypothetical protein DIPPA_25146 [Diplonema papillatum]|nr:hypothetical protein DIPPA_25146 [Diplonema papillatum]
MLRRAGTGADRREASILAKAERHGPRRAVIDSSREWSYDQLLDKASGLAGRLQARRRRGSNPMVLVLTEPGGAYVVSTFAAWGSSLCSVPLCAAHTVREMVYYATDCGASVLLHDTANAARAANWRSFRRRLVGEKTIQLNAYAQPRFTCSTFASFL